MEPLFQKIRILCLPLVIETCLTYLKPLVIDLNQKLWHTVEAMMSVVVPLYKLDSFLRDSGSVLAVAVERDAWEVTTREMQLGVPGKYKVVNPNFHFPLSHIA